jgi:Ca2+-binding EF-hand superfamily protein
MTCCACWCHREELETACKKHYGEEMSRLVVANLINEVDVDLNGKISTSELLSACLATQVLPSSIHR